MASLYSVYVKTGDRRNAGTDANVYIILYDEKNNKTSPFKLDNFLKNDLERGHLDTFKIKDKQTLSDISVIEIWRDEYGLASDWYVDTVTVEIKKNGDKYEFPLFRWIKAGYHYHVRHRDTSLPQLDPNGEQRVQYLEEKRKTYEFVVNVPGAPSQVSHTRK